MAKLTDEQRRAVKVYHARGTSIRTLARDFGVARGTIRYILYPEEAERRRVAARERQREVRQSNKVNEDK